jgi:MalT-like TPR region
MSKPWPSRPIGTGSRYPRQAWLTLGSGRSCASGGALDGAERHLEDAIDLGRRSGLDGIVVDGSITLALVASARGEFDRGFELLRQSARIVHGWRDPANAVRVRTFEARLT